MIRTFFQSGGQMLQVTSANPEELRDAMEHPESHQDLIIRIGGFSIQFVQLGRESQMEVISRYEGA